MVFLAGVDLEKAIANAADFLARNIAGGGAVDEHMQDQVVIWSFFYSALSLRICS